jgi:hypothetical protein
MQLRGLRHHIRIQEIDQNSTFRGFHFNRGSFTSTPSFGALLKASQSRFPEVSPATGALSTTEPRTRRTNSSSVINTNLFFLRSTNCGPSFSALSKTALNFALASATAQFAITHLQHDHSSQNDHSSHFSLRSALAHIRSTARARHFIALVPSRKNRSTISSASSRSETSCKASSPIPSTAEHITTLLSFPAIKPIVRAARNRCARVRATRGTTSPRCHRVRDSSTGSVSSNPANSSA